MELLDAAFGGDPGAVVTSPPGAAPDRRWVTAVVLGGQGRYAAAATLLGELLADRTVPAAVAAHAAVTLAAHRRQLGGHGVARRWDALGLRLATAACSGGRGSVGSGARVGLGASGASVAPAARVGLGAPPGDLLAGPVPDPGLDAASARIDALVGLAADALGLLDLAGARRLLAAADRLLGDPPYVPRPEVPPPGAAAALSALPRPRRADAPGAPGAPALARSWRPGVRANWVRAELALLEGRAAHAVVPAEAALAASCRAGALRHTLKSRLVLAVARAAADPAASADAQAELAAVREEAAGHSLLPLVWPAALAAADLARHADPHVKSGLHHTAMTTVSVLKDYADPVGRRLMGESVWVPRVAVGSLTAPLGPSSPT